VAVDIVLGAQATGGGSALGQDLVELLAGPLNDLDARSICRGCRRGPLACCHVGLAYRFTKAPQALVALVAPFPRGTPGALSGARFPALRPISVSS